MRRRDLRPFASRLSDSDGTFGALAECGEVVRGGLQAIPKGQYEAAAAEMITRCSPPEAPFTLVEANDKRFARVKVLETLCERLADEL